MSISTYSFSQTTEKAEEYLELFGDYEYVDQEKAKAYLDSAQSLENEIKDQEILGKIDLYTGWFYQDISQFDRSRDFFFKSLDHYAKAGNYNRIADVYGNLGNSFLDVGDLKNALDYQLKSLRTNEKILLLSNDEEMLHYANKGRAYAWTNLSNIYKTLGHYNKAKVYEIKAMQYEKDYGDSVGLAISYINLGTTYDNLDQMDSAIYFTQLAHEIFKRQDYSLGLINSYITLYKYGKLEGDENIDYLLNAYQYARKFDDKYSEVYVLGYLISAKADFSKDSLNNMVQRANHLLDKYELQKPLYRFYADEATYFARLGQYRNAYESMVKYVELYSNLKEENEGFDVKNEELKHEFELQSLEDSLKFEKVLNDQKLVNEKRIGRQRIYTTVTIFGFGILAVILVFVYRSLRVRKENNKKLSDKNALIERQKELVEEKNKEITDSITYAQRLQNAILPSIDQINQTFPGAFIHFFPKDVVSGDFYWFEQNEDYNFIAVADCTGHGVPGAMVSVVCSNALNRAVNEFGLSQPKEILNKTRELVIATFAKSGENVKDGMDICLCAFNRERTQLIYAGAFNPLWIIRKNEFISESEMTHKSTVRGDEKSLIEITASKQPVGSFEKMKDFKETKIQIQEGDSFYLFSDGYADQFGGEKGKKLKYRKFKSILLETDQMSCEEQNNYLKKFMENWKSEIEQVDDICVMGLRT